MLRAAVVFLAVATAVCSAAPLQRVLLISIDGLRADYLSDETVREKFPTLSRLVKEGFWSRQGVVGVLPTVTYPTHTSLVTGADPDEHGIRNNIVFNPEGAWGHWDGSGDQWYWNQAFVATPTLYDLVSNVGGKTASVFWPVTVGAPVDYLVPEIWPKQILPQVSSSLALEACKDIFDEILSSDEPWVYDSMRHRMVLAMLEEKPHFMSVHYADLDHFEHIEGPMSDKALATLKEIDVYLAEIVDKLSNLEILDETTLVITSDHGFAHIANLTAPNTYLSTLPVTSGTSWSAYAWVAGGSAGIYVHPKAPQAVREEVAAWLKNTDELYDLWGVGSVLSPAEAHELGGFPGAEAVLVARSGFAFSSAKTGPPRMPSVKKGTHGFHPKDKQMYASLIMHGSAIIPATVEGPLQIVDVAPTIAGLYNEPFPVRRGRVLLEALKNKPTDGRVRYYISTGVAIGIGIFVTLITLVSVGFILHMFRDKYREPRWSGV